MKKLNNRKCNPWRVLFLSFCVVLLIVTLTSCRNNEEPLHTEPHETENDAIESIETTEQSTAKETEEMTEIITEAITEEFEDSSLNVFPTDGKNIGIGIFWEPPAEFTTPEQYDWIRDANITFIEITNHRGGNNKENMALQLKLAQERGITVAYSVGMDGQNLLNMSELEIVNYVTELKKNPTVTDIHVIDEPAQPWIWSSACAAISKAGVNPRLNFLPYWELGCLKIIVVT